MSRPTRWVLATGCLLALSVAALPGPRTQAKARVIQAYRCVAPVPLQHAVARGPTWPRADVPAPARDALRAHLDGRGHKAFVIVRNGETLFESYAPCHGPHAPHYTASAAKALVGGLLAAVALDEGWLSLDDPATAHVPDWREDPTRAFVTLRQLASHTSGLDAAEEGYEFGPELPGWKGDFWGPPQRRWSIALEAPMATAPGVEFRYSNPGFAVFSLAVASAAAEGGARDLRTVYADRIMRPLGVPDREWSLSDGRVYSKDGLTLIRMGGGAQFSARALVAIGALLLGDPDPSTGLPSAASLREVTAHRPSPSLAPPEADPAPAIGWHTNRNGRFASLPEDAVLAAGAEHQVVVVVPSLDLVLVRNGLPLGGRKWGPEYWDRLEDEIVAPAMAFLDAAG